MEQETYIPGLNEGAHRDSNKNGRVSSVSPYEDPNANIKDPSRNYNFKQPDSNSQTPVVGFLYTVSKNGFPEYWPLHIGQNTIGKDNNMDICLKESSISDHHANIQIKKMRTNGGRLIATIVDAGSKNGIVVNDEELDYDRHPLKHMDIITIGLNYQLVCLLIDPIEIGLDVSKNFKSISATEKTEEKEAPVVPENRTYHPDNVPPVQSPYGNPYGNPEPIQDETINIQGNYSGLNAGGTRIM